MKSACQTCAQIISNHEALAKEFHHDHALCEEHNKHALHTPATAVTAATQPELKQHFLNIESQHHIIII
jgi:hypothetical protein